MKGLFNQLHRGLLISSPFLGKLIIAAEIPLLFISKNDLIPLLLSPSSMGSGKFDLIFTMF